MRQEDALSALCSLGPMTAAELVGAVYGKHPGDPGFQPLRADAVDTVIRLAKRGHVYRQSKRRQPSGQYAIVWAVRP